MVPSGLRRFVYMACACVASVCSGSSAARGDDMDLALSRLSSGACTETLGEAGLALESHGRAQLTPDNASFRQLVAQLAGAVAPPLLAPVTTGGPAGFDVAIDTTVTRIADSAQYWQRGTRGSAALTCDGRNDDVAPALTSTRLRFSKGLPLGLSVGASLGKLHRTELWTFGAELKLGIIEGATDPWTPSFGVRLATSSLVSSGALSLTTLSADAILSKEWPVARALHLVPYAAVGSVYGGARTATIDLTPNIDANACAAGLDPTCNAAGLGASAADFAHDRTFRRVALLRHRATLGLWLRYESFALAAEAMFDLAAPRIESRRSERQWGINVAPSLSF